MRKNKLGIVCLLLVRFILLVKSDDVDSFSDAMVKAIAEKNKEVEAESDAMVKAIEEKAAELESLELEKKFQKASDRVDQVANDAEKATQLKVDEGDKKQLLAENKVEEQIKQLETKAENGDEKQLLEEKKMEEKINKVESAGRFRRRSETQGVKSHEKSTTRNQKPSNDLEETNKRIVASLNLNSPRAKGHQDQSMREKHRPTLKESDFYQPPIKLFNINQDLVTTDENMDGFDTGQEIEKWKYDPEKWGKQAELLDDGYKQHNFAGLGQRLATHKNTKNIKHFVRGRFEGRTEKYKPNYWSKPRLNDDVYKKPNSNEHHLARQIHAKNNNQGNKNLLTIEVENMKKAARQSLLLDNDLQDAAERGENFNYVEGNNEVMNAEERWLALQSIGSPEFHGVHVGHSTGKINDQEISIVSPGDVDLVQAEFPLTGKPVEDTLKKRTHLQHAQKIQKKS